VSIEPGLLAQSAEELFERLPCGYLATDAEGLIVRVNETFERWTGLQRAELIGRVRFQDLLTAGGQIYHETHFHPLLMMQGAVSEIALEVRRSDGTTLPVLVNSALHRDAEGRPRLIRTTVFEASERRHYERELLEGRRREHEIAQRLQDSMLGGELPTAPAFELSVFYAPVVETLDIGGDWYDAFWLGDSAIGLVVGDVVGRGIEAAATMGQLRSAVRALASTGLEPAALIEALDAFARRHGVGQTATLVYAQLDLSDGALRFTCAGHMPPAVMTRDEAARLLWTGRSWPLDMPGRPQPRGEATCTLPPGGTLVLYTDGLVEHRSRSLDDGLDALVATLEDLRDAPLPDTVAALPGAVGIQPRDDDVCVLGVRLREAG
jgi:PAS domain S-box-containing protein